MMRVDDLITFLKREFPTGIQMFDTRNILGDTLTNIYDKDGICVDYCYGYEYIEIFGLTEEEFENVMREAGM